MSSKNQICKSVPVSKGTTILSEKPFAYVVTSKNRTKICNYCLQSRELLKCSRCQYVYYCDRNCQRKAWLVVHKIECTYLMKRRLVFELDDTAWLMARVIIKLNQGGADETNYSDIEKDKDYMAHFCSLYAFLYVFLGEALMPKMSELLVIYGRISINSFYIKNFDMDNIGIGLYLGASVLNHSCNPNVIAVFNGPTIVVRTLVDLPSLDWSQLWISYVDLIDYTNKQKTLCDVYYFRCNCEKYKQIEPMVKAAVCPNSLCASPCSIETDECEKCGAKLSEDFKKAFREVTACTAYHLNSDDTSCILTNLKAFGTKGLDDYKKCLKKQKDVMYSFNVLRIRTLEWAVKTAMESQNWKDAELYCKELELGYLLYYGEVYPQTGLFYFMTGTIYFYLKKWNLALEALRKANTILTITHGEHPLINNLVQPIIFLATMKET